LAADIRFYLDENMQVAIAEQLGRRGIDVVTARDLHQLGDDDANHLERATKMGRVLSTHDSDYIDLATAGTQHAGIIFGQQDKHTIVCGSHS
jgi:predicted nuclease of predicted toxin-antitoxin system